MNVSRTRVTAAFGAVVLVALHLWLARNRTDFLLADGTGYLANARWLAGEAGTTWQGAAAFYHAGWSLLVAPAYAVTRSPDAIHTYVIVLNALLAAGSALACALVGRRLFGLSARWSLLAGLVAGTYPAVLLQSGFEWSESLYFLLFPLFALAAHRLVSRPTVAAAVLTGLAAAALNATHPRGVGVVAATALALVGFGALRRLPRREAAIALGTLVLGFVATRLLHGVLLDALYDQSAAAIEGGVLSRLTEPRLVWATFERFWGQTWYLTAATVGLAPLGVWTAARTLDRRVSLFVLGGAALMLAASCLQMSDGTRVDHLVYGRYDEGFLPVLLVAAVAGLHRLTRTAVVVGAATLPLLGVLAVLFNGMDRFTGAVMPLNVLGVLVYERTRDEIVVLTVTAIATGVLVLLAALHRVRAEAAVLLLVVGFVGSSAAVEARTLQPWSRPFMAATQIPDVLDRFDAAVVWIERETVEVDAANAYQLELTDRSVRFYDGTTPPDGAELVIAPTQWQTRPPGARMVHAEVVVHREALWVLPGELQDRLAAEGELVPAQTSAPLPASAQRAMLELDGCTVHVRNDGDGTWLPVGPIPGVVEGTVRLGARWFDETGVEVASETAELPRIVHPGESVDVRLRLDADLPPGELTLRVTLRQESVAWWEDSSVERQVRARS